MSGEGKLSAFPSSEEEAIALLYTQHQDLTGKNPVEIYNMYLKAYYEILKDRRGKINSGWFQKKNEESLKG